MNVCLDALFMFGFDWGIKGAAFATITGQIISFVIGILYFRNFKTFDIHLNMLGIRVEYAITIIKLGTSNFINHIIMMIVNIVLNNMLRKYGALSVYGSDIPLAVSGIAAKLNSVLASFAVGLAQGCQPILGFNMGAKNYDRVKKTYKTALSTALCIGLVAFAAFQIFPRQGFFLIPLLIIMPIFFGLNGVLYAAPIADVLACVLALSLIARNFNHLDGMKK